VIQIKTISSDEENSFDGCVNEFIKNNHINNPSITFLIKRHDWKNPPKLNFRHIAHIVYDDGIEYGSPK
jgi:hypothetical protein